jgi:DNA-binding transcriptional LysR family regulator
VLITNHREKRDDEEMSIRKAKASALHSPVAPAPVASQDFQLDWLRSFVAAVDGGSLASACEVVHRSPAALSMHVKKLEQAAGGALLHRDARRFWLTPLGERLLPHARAVLQAHAAAVAAVAVSPVQGRVRFGFPEDYAAELLGPALRRFAESHPAVEVVFTCAQSTVLIPALEQGELDVALVTQDRPRRGTRLYEERYVWLGHPGHSVWQQDPLPLAAFEPGSMARTMPEAALKRARRRYRLAYESPSTVGLIAVVQSGLAVAAIKRSACPPGLMVLGERQGLPELSPLHVAVVLSERSENDHAAQALHQHVVQLQTRIR